MKAHVPLHPTKQKTVQVDGFEGRFFDPPQESGCQVARRRRAKAPTVASPANIKA